MSDRRCTGITRAGGPCRAAPLTGRDHCSAHDPIRPDKTRFGSPEQASRAGASPKPRALKLTEALNRRIDEQADAVIAALFEALLATRGITIRVGDGKDELASTPDYATRIVAAREILDRGLGRPRQAVELTGEDGRPIELANAGLDLRKLTNDELDALQRLVDRATPHR
jgi:hypothetical protein